jgi:hypothetical protein
MKEEIKTADLETKKVWTEPKLFSFDFKDTKGGGGPNTSEDETWNPGSLTAI